MRNVVLALTLIGLASIATTASADALIAGEQVQLASPVVAAGQYNLDVSVTGVGSTADIWGFQFEMDFADSNLQFDSFTSIPVQLPVTPVVGSTVIVGGSNLFGAPIFTLQDGVTSSLGTVTFTVLADTLLAEIPILTSVNTEIQSDQLGAPTGLIELSPAVSLQLTAAPVPSPTGLAGICSLGLIGACGVFRRRRNA